MSSVGYEFSTIAYLPGTMNASGSVSEVVLMECGVCHALVQERSSGQHYEWHRDEGHLRP